MGDENSMTLEEQLQAKNDELQRLHKEFEEFKQATYEEIAQRNTREFEMLQRLYHYMSSELGYFRQNAHVHGAGG